MRGSDARDRREYSAHASDASSTSFRASASSPEPHSASAGARGAEADDANEDEEDEDEDEDEEDDEDEVSLESESTGGRGTSTAWRRASASIASGEMRFTSAMVARKRLQSRPHEQQRERRPFWPDALPLALELSTQLLHGLGSCEATGVGVCGFGSYSITCGFPLLNVTTGAPVRSAGAGALV